MNITHLEARNTGGYDIKPDGQTYPYHVSYHDTNNCKLTILESVGQLDELKDDQLKEVFDFIKTDSSGRNLFIHINSKKLWQWLQDNYEHYYAVEVPCGYNGSNQYHILLKNRTDDRKPYKYKKAKNEDVSKIVNDAFSKTTSRSKRIELIINELSK